MTECNVMYVATSFFVVNLLCTIILTPIIKQVTSLKKYSGQTNMGKEIYKLTMMGYLAYLVVSTAVFAIVVLNKIGAENFA